MEAEGEEQCIYCRTYGSSKEHLPPRSLGESRTLTVRINHSLAQGRVP
jgi:hypothetical protein